MTDRTITASYNNKELYPGVRIVRMNPEFHLGFIVGVCKNICIFNDDGEMWILNERLECKGCRRLEYDFTKYAMVECDITKEEYDMIMSLRIDDFDNLKKAANVAERLWRNFMAIPLSHFPANFIR